MRWNNAVVCPYCSSKETSKHLDRKQCQECRKSFSITVGAIFHHTHLDLRMWFYIISLMIDAKKGISAYQVSRNTGIRRGTCWKIMNKIREAMDDNEQKALLTGIFEMYETYIKADKEDGNDSSGGCTGRSLKNNTPIVAIKQKNGDLKAVATENTEYSTLGAIAMNFAEVGSEIHTDEYASYHTFKTFYNHKTVNHHSG